MAVVRVARAHIDTVLAGLLVAAYLIEIYLLERPASGTSFVRSLDIEEPAAVVATVVFLASMVVRTHLPLVPLALAYPALALAGRGSLDEPLVVTVGLVLSVYSVGAWAGGRSGQVGALGVGGLIGLLTLRLAAAEPETRDVAIAAVVLVGAWLVGLAARSLRLGRGDPRVSAGFEWRGMAAAPDSAGRDETVRELRDVVERSMSAVIIGARNASSTLDDDPRETRRSLSVIESAGNEALVETQRLTGELLSPDGTRAPEPTPGLSDLDFLAEHVTEAGLPVDMRIEGTPVPLTPDLDGVAYRVVHEALMNTLENAEASHADVVVRYERDELRIEIVDDGIGLEEQEPDEETAGLVAVRNDVAGLGGTLDAGPGRDRGYSVTARIPYEPDWQ